jgi:hypothetical protein
MGGSTLAWRGWRALDDGVRAAGEAAMRLGRSCPSWGAVTAAIPIANTAPSNVAQTRRLAAADSRAGRAGVPGGSAIRGRTDSVVLKLHAPE